MYDLYLFYFVLFVIYIMGVVMYIKFNNRTLNDIYWGCETKKLTPKIARLSFIWPLLQTYRCGKMIIINVNHFVCILIGVENNEK